ncbi:DUF1428 domain-containing protein [Mameliella sediminis]|uniref:DUF1428 domain-containing protein n=1 Tax=Mameliella sediminis TaxID=2836866 RepID=UPI001C4674EB|nr:DUF1428 domain-containing protein [Mameliella sediminis]MBV7393148.1 DUF1428 domain-containing protein [Mameliella sediminis]
MPYYDIFLAPVLDAKRADYDAFVKTTHEMFIGFGASEVVDLWPSDVPEGELTSLPLAVKLEAGESVAAGYIVWPSKEVRDAGWAKMMNDEPQFEMPFDGKRMIFGGFDELLRTRA